MPDDSLILEAFNEVAENAVVPAEGPLQLFYDALTDHGTAFTLHGENDSVLFFIHSEDIIESIVSNSAGCAFYFVDIGETFLLTIKAGADEFETDILLNFSKTDRRHMEFLRGTRRDGIVTIQFISFMYGELHKRKPVAFNLPEPVRNTIPEI